MSLLTTTFTNAKDIDDFFKEKTGKKFVDYFNDKHAGQGKFAKNNGKPSVPPIGNKYKGNWEKVWNSISVLFGKSEINLAEFLSINTAMHMETGSTFRPSAEIVGSSSRGVPGMSYAFNPVKGIKSSYNAGNTATDLSNKTAFKLFNDSDYITAHGHKPFGNILKDTTDTRWGTDTFPIGFSGTDAEKETDRSGKRSGFIFEADFMKFRGRGFIQTTGRGNYIDIIKFILSYTGNQSVVKKYKNKWAKYGSNHNRIATVSSNQDWDTLFNKSDLIIPNVSVDIHASKSGRRNGGPQHSQYNNIDVSVSEDDVLKTNGPVWWVGRRINGAVKYANALLARVVQVMDALEDPDAEIADNENDTQDENTPATDPAQDENQDDSDTDSGDNQSSNDQLPKMEGITNFFTAETTKLNLVPIEYDNPDEVRRKQDIADAGNLPIIAYGNKPIEPRHIKTFTLNASQLLPTVNITFMDPLGTINDKAFPLDDTKIKIFINSRTQSLRHILMEFKIVSFSKNKQNINIRGVCNINRFFLRKFEAIQDMTSFKAIQDFVKKSGTGFSSNIQDTDDKMTWINPGDTGESFVKEMLKKSFVNDESFMWGYIDLYYNFNYIDVEKALTQDIKNQGAVYSNNAESTLGKSDEEVSKLVLSNDTSIQGSNNYFESYRVISNSGISLKKGYLNKVKFYNQQDIDFNVFDIDSITTDADNKIIMKGSPQDNDYFGEHIVTTYTGKLDTDNAHKNYNYAPVQNEQNLDDIQKVGIILDMKTPNFNLYRFQKVEVMISNGKTTATQPLTNQRLKGEWLIIDIKFKMVKGKFNQVLTLVKRELELSDEELKKEEVSEAPETVESGQEEPDTTPVEEQVPPPEPEPEPVGEEVEAIVFDFEKTFKNSSEIDEYFKSLGGNSSGYVDWFNDNAGGAKQLNKEGWTKVWNSIDIIFGKEEINMAEFLSLNSVIYLSHNYKSTHGSPVPDGSGTPQSFSFTSDFAQLYEKNNFRDPEFESIESLSEERNFNKAHGHLKFGSLLNNIDLNNEVIDDFFSDDTGSFPEGFSGITDEDDRFFAETDEKSYLAQSDFYKVRSRGMILTGGRTHYKELVKHVLDYSGDNGTIKRIKNKWLNYEFLDVNGESGGKLQGVFENIGSDSDILNIIIEISNDLDWKALFDEVEFQIIALGIRLKGVSSVGGRTANNIHHIDVKGKSEDKIETSMLNLAKSVLNIKNLQKKHIPLIKKQVGILQEKADSTSST